MRVFSWYATASISCWMIAIVLLLIACGVPASVETDPLPSQAPETAPIIVSAATVTETAVRGTQATVGPTEAPPTAPPVPTGLWGLPFAPDGLDNCDEMNFYRVQFGLPERFSSLGWRESNCRNEEGVKTYCCWGYWQLYFSQHMKDHRMAPRYAECGIDDPYDYNGDEPLDKQKQACAAKALYDTVGYSAWAL